MMDPEFRSLENTDKMRFFGVGPFDIPPILPVYKIEPDDVPIDMVPFDVCKRKVHPDKIGVHFYMPDYKMARVWTHPDIYTEMLKRYRFVCTPDFSMYTNWPVALQINSHYRKHWLGYYWQERGMTVIPSVSWSDKRSYEWCFDGDPKNSIIAISSVGTQAELETKLLFMSGFEEMLNRLYPRTILFHGDIPDEAKALCEQDKRKINIVRILAYHAKLRKMEGRKPYGR